MNKTYNEYIKELAGREVTVVGMGISNKPLVRMLAAAGARVTAVDRNPDIEREEWDALGVTLKLGEGYLDGLDGDLIFRTPGLRPDNPALLGAAGRGSRITSEIEALFEVCPCPIIGVTGSDGKTTTTTLIAEMLKAAGRTVHLGGNIGTPLLTRAGEMSPGDVCVLELSSFQLADMRHSPQIAVITNISPNHLDWHTDMAEYTAAKRAIFEYHTEGGLAVFNADNAVTAAMRGPDRSAFFGGHRIIDGIIDGFLPVSEIKLRGWHNVENMMAAITALEGLVPRECMLSVARGFGGVAHRDEFVCETGGVRYYNDSIGSSPSRTIATLKSHPGRVILIAGGRGKNVPFAPLAEILPEKVSLLLLVGEAAGQIESAAREVPGCPPILRAGDIASAVALAAENARPGDEVLLSPACTSFDQYRNFEERGEHFRKLAEQL